MAAANTDKFIKVGESTATTLSAPGYTTGATSINVAATTNWPTDTGVMFAVDEVDADGLRVPGTYNVFVGVVSSATQISSLSYVGGDANRDYSAGATTRVYIHVGGDRIDRLVDGLLVSHDQDGSLKAGAVDVAGVIADQVIETKIGTKAIVGGTEYFTSSGTWTKPANLKFVEVEVQAGGGGTGVAGSTVASEASEASGGGGGEYARGKILAADLAATEAITVGAGGAGRTTATTTPGGTGGTSSFGSHITAIGGEGGVYMAGTTGSMFNQGGSGGSGGTGGDMRIPGGDGNPAVVSSGATINSGRKNSGGASFLSTTVNATGSATNGNAVAGHNYGGGSAGARNGISEAFRAGADGGAGIVIVHEYF